MALTLRPYQEEAIVALYDYWRSGKGHNPLISMPTGSGKSLIISEAIRRTCKHWPQTRVCVITDRKELIEQDAAEFRRQWPEADIGVYSAGLNRRDTGNHILFVGIQSVYKRAFELGKIDLLIVDECHMIPRDSQTRYGQFIADVKTGNPSAAIIGLTATPYRLDSGLLYEGEDALFDGIAYEADMQELIKDGYLAPVISKGGTNKIDLTSVKTRMGDYAAGDLEMAADDAWVVHDAVQEIISYGQDRRSWLVFAAGVKHAKHIKFEMIAAGVSCALVAGSPGDLIDDRDRAIKGFKEGSIRCLINIGVLTTGFNAPRCDLIALLTATKSTSKYIQMVGRGMRTADSKEDCLLLDYGANVVTHGPVDAVCPHTKAKSDGTEEAPCKECPECNSIVHASVRECPECGHQFPPPKLKQERVAFAGAVMSDQEVPKWVEVDEIAYDRHHKEGGKHDTLKATYIGVDGRKYYQWFAPDHGGYARKKALEYIKACGGAAKTVDDALKESWVWQDPTRIKVKRDGKFMKITAFDFPEVTA